MFISDRQRWNSIGEVGTDGIKTPHIDRLADEGVTFSRAYCTAPLCTPARMSIFTGRYPHDHGMVTNGGPMHQPRPGLDLMRYPEGPGTWGTI